MYINWIDKFDKMKKIIQQKIILQQKDLIYDRNSKMHKVITRYSAKILETKTYLDFVY